MKQSLQIPALIAIAAGTLCLGAAAEESVNSQPVRHLFERHDQSGVPGKEVVIGSAELPAGASIGYHTHAGDEAGFILKGSFTLRIKGQPDRVLRTGDTFFTPRGAVHSATAGAQGATAISTWIVDKGVPLATPAQ